jgi:precorrin-2/cobalt-factor-2 C20-methyltransferase
VTGRLATGRLAIVGVGPGDPELMTLKSVRRIASAAVVAHFAKRDADGHARRIAAAHIPGTAEELRFDFPVTTEIPATDPAYADAMATFYDAAAVSIAARLEAGLDVAILCEADPFFYGSAMHLFDRLSPRFACEVIPGVTGMSACWTAARLPITQGDDVLTVLPGTLGCEQLAEQLARCDAAVIMKVGRHLAKIRAAVRTAGREERAVYVERGSMAEERVLALADAREPAPYFSLVLIPGRQRAR